MPGFTESTVTYLQVKSEDGGHCLFLATEKAAREGATSVSSVVRMKSSSARRRFLTAGKQVEGKEHSVLASQGRYSTTASNLRKMMEEGLSEKDGRGFEGPRCARRITSRQRYGTPIDKPPQSGLPWLTSTASPTTTRPSPPSTLLTHPSLAPKLRSTPGRLLCYLSVPEPARCMAQRLHQDA